MTTSALESAILIKIPQVERLVGRHRRVLDPSEKWGIPAHVTLLYPFLPPDKIDAKVFTQLETVIGSLPSFNVYFSRTGWFGDEVLWLSPEPASAFRELMGALFFEFPGLLPYGDADLEPTPHLTVAYRADLEIMRQVESLITPKLPINALVSSVSVMTGSQEPGSWRTLTDISLRMDS